MYALRMYIRFMDVWEREGHTQALCAFVCNAHPIYINSISSYVNRIEVQFVYELYMYVCVCVCASIYVHCTCMALVVVMLSCS